MLENYFSKPMTSLPAKTGRRQQLEAILLKLWSPLNTGIKAIAFIEIINYKFS